MYGSVKKIGWLTGSLTGVWRFSTTTESATLSLVMAMFNLSCDKVLNITGIRKALKKFEKVTKVYAPVHFRG
jgi:hypothetical protein